MRKKISQREARRLLKEVSRLQDRYVKLTNPFWVSGTPGTLISSLSMSSTHDEKIALVQKLGFMIVVKMDGAYTHFYAVKP